MNAIEALEKSIELWTWLAKNPDKYKHDYHTYNKKDWKEKWKYNCPLCEFAWPDCEDCPMYDLWETKSGLSKYCEEVVIERDETFYDLYRKTINPLDRSFYAKKLIESFKKRLKELNECSRQTP